MYTNLHNLTTIDYVLINVSVTNKTKLHIIFTKLCMYIVLIIGFVFFFFLYTRIVKAIVYKTKTNWVLYIYIYIVS
jgi:hypothetical protein